MPLRTGSTNCLCKFPFVYTSLVYVYFRVIVRAAFWELISLQIRSWLGREERGTLTVGRFGTSYISGGSSKLRCGAEAAARPGEARSTAASFFVAAAPGPARSVPPPGCGAARPSPLQICFCVLGTASVSPGRREQRAVWQPAWRAAAGTERGQPAPREPLAARRALRPVAADAWLARPGSACCSGASSCAAEGRPSLCEAKLLREKAHKLSIPAPRAALPSVRCRSARSRRAGAIAAPFPGVPARLLGRGSPPAVHSRPGSRRSLPALPLAGPARREPLCPRWVRGAWERARVCGLSAVPLLEGLPIETRGAVIPAATALSQRRVCRCTVPLGFDFSSVFHDFDSWRIVCDLIVILFYKLTRMLQYLLTGIICSIYQIPFISSSLFFCLFV